MSGSKINGLKREMREFNFFPPAAPAGGKKGLFGKRQWLAARKEVLGRATLGKRRKK